MISFPSLFKIPDDAMEIVPQLFSIFRRDFIDNTTYFLSSPVVIPRPHENEVYPDTFWHIVSKQEVKGSQNINTRLLDYERVKRIVWLKPLIEQFREPEVLKWRQVEFDKNSGKELMKYYLWYKDGQYMTVLKTIEKNGNKYFIATAFYVFKNREPYFEEMYSKGEKFCMT